MDRAEFEQVVTKNGLTLSESQFNSIAQLVDLIRNWNEKINLVSRRDIEQIWIRHLLGSISFLFRFSLQKETKLLDLGTGGGLPGLPLAIIFPDVKFLLLDSIQKKIKAVDDMIMQLGLKNVTAVCKRAEATVAEKQYQNQFHYVIARGVGDASDIVKWSKPFLTSTNRRPDLNRATKNQKEIIAPPAILLLKGGDLKEEVQRTQIKAHPTRLDVYPLSVHGVESEYLFEKKIVIIRA
jgi:16S rRNA (guanine527-N7)-methyltransferase